MDPVILHFMIIFKLAKRGWGLIAGSRAFQAQMIHAQDLAEAIIMACLNNQVQGTYFCNSTESGSLG